MKIVTKEEFLYYPSGTVFAEWVPSMFTSEIKIKTGYYQTRISGDPHWNGELSLQPFVNIDEEEAWTSWWTVDGADSDYDQNQLFAVFSTTDVMQMINCLTWALTGCDGFFNQDVSYADNGIALFED